MTGPTSIADLRREYALARLDEADVSHDPIVEFARWFAEAQEAEVPEPNAMTLATATPDGEPSARIVLLKAFDERGFVFFTDYRSRKGGELEANPRAALVFRWGEVERQVRITGGVALASREESEPTSGAGRSAAGSARGPHTRARSFRGGRVLEQDFRQVEQRFGRRRAAAAVLGRVPRGAGLDRVLAGAGEPAARQDQVRSAEREGMAGGAVVTLRLTVSAPAPAENRRAPSWSGPAPTGRRSWRSRS